MINDIVLLIPSLDPDEKLIRTVDNMLSAGFGKILIVNDGSKKENLWPFERLKNHSELEIIGYEENRGKGYALKYGLNYIIENYSEAIGVVTCDGDGQHLATDCILVAQALRERDELIFGCRNFKDPVVPFRNKAGNTISIFMYQFLCGIKLSDTQTGLRAIPSRFLKEFALVEGDRFEYETNTLLYMKSKEYSFSEVPINTIYESDSNSGSHFRVFEDSYRIYKLLFKFGGPRLIKFMTGSVLSFLIDIGIFSLLTALLSKKNGEFLAIIGSVFLASLFARICSSLFNFYFNKKAVFKSDSKSCLGRYFMLALAQLCVSALLVAIISYVFKTTGFARTFSKCVVDAVLFIISYQIQREWVFK